jgi:predicted TIM-barrel fold metal-dependent hydrolase
MSQDSIRDAELLPERQQDYHLINAEREIRKRGIFDVPVVDCDSHCYETSSLPEIVNYIENPNIRRSFEFNSLQLVEGAMISGSLGDRTVAGRLRHGGAKAGERDVYPIEQNAGNMHPVAATTIRAMDAMGIDYTILFPTPMLNLGLNPDLNVRDQLTFAFNRWLIDDVISSDPRLKTMPVLPVHDPDQCLRTIRAFGDKPGVIGFMIVALNYEPIHRNNFMKVFAELDERRLPVAFHSAPNWREQAFTVLDSFLGVHALGFPFYAMVQLTNVVLTGMPERFPNIRWIFMEAGQAWVPFTIARLDNEYKQRSSEAPLLKRLPSEYIRDFYFTTQPFESHERGADTRAMFDMMDGHRSYVYASDYPHQDFDTPAAIWDVPQFTEEEKRAILGGNALNLFNLPVPAGAATASV